MALLPAAAEARRPSTAELAEAGLTDPRVRPAPPRHRIRLSVMADAIKASAAISGDGRIQRFYFAPLMLDVAYQVQFLRYLMLRPSFAVGPNVANTKQAMPLVFQPGLFFGYQGRILGAAAGYSFILARPATIGVDDGHFGLVQPVLDKNHALQVEVSVTTKIDRGALNFAVRYGGVKTHLTHLDLDKKTWKGVFTLSAGWFFELGARRQRRQKEQAPQARSARRWPL